MRRSILALVMLFLMLLGSAPPLRAQSSGGGIPLEMGYGPVALFPVQSGTPVYTVGDQLWVESGYTSTLEVSVQPTFGSSNGSIFYLNPGTPTRLLTFNNSDSQGYWEITTLNGFYTAVYFQFLNSPAYSNLTLTGRSLSGSVLDMNFSTGQGLFFYQGEACPTKGGNADWPQVKVPAALGGGTVTLLRNGGKVTAQASSLRNNTFSFSAEMYYPYSFLAPNSSALLYSREVRVATTDTADFSGSQGTAQLSLSNETESRPGAYELRAIFQGEAGTFLSTTEVLVLNDGSWVWLGGCTQVPVYSNDFTVTVPLASGPGSWPADVYFTYFVGGVEGYSSSEVGMNVSSVQFIGGPWGGSLKGYQIQALNQQGIEDSSVSNGTVYMLLQGGPAFFDFSASLGNRTYFSGRAGPINPSTASQIVLNVSKLQVTYLVGTTPFEGARVTVSGSEGVITTGSTNSKGVATFYLPPGSFNVSATGGNVSSAAAVQLVAREAVAVVLQGSAQQGDESLALVLLGAAGAGVILNAGLYIRGRRTAPRVR